MHAIWVRMSPYIDTPPVEAPAAWILGLNFERGQIPPRHLVEADDRKLTEPTPSAAVKLRDACIIHKISGQIQQISKPQMPRSPFAHAMSNLSFLWEMVHQIWCRPTADEAASKRQNMPKIPSWPNKLATQNMDTMQLNTKVSHRPHTTHLHESRSALPKFMVQKLMEPMIGVVETRLEAHQDVVAHNIKATKICTTCSSHKKFLTTPWAMIASRGGLIAFY